jgi:hypothetical protein
LSVAGTPLLSICVPTFERADELRVALESIVPQVAEHDDAVELVVSDNCSADHTAAVVDEARRWGPLRYHRTDRNLGPGRNFMLAVEELARGEYCWLVGDDDMLVAGGLRRIVSLLREHRGLAALFVNYYVASPAHCARLVHEHGSEWLPEQPAYLGAEAWCMPRDERLLDRWEDALRVESVIPALTFVSIVCHVFRRSIWLANTHHVRRAELPGAAGESVASLGATYPHTVVLAHGLVGRPALYVGDPPVVQGVGAQTEWIQYLPMFLTVRTLDALRLYERLGVDVGLVTSLRRDFVSPGSVFENMLERLLRDERAVGREFLSLRRLVREDPALVRPLAIMLLRTYARALRQVGRRLPRPLRHAARTVYRSAPWPRGR